MTREQVLYYDEDELREKREAASYPCNTDRMVYDVYLHRYKLTVSALLDFGIDIEADEFGGNSRRVESFIDEVSEDIYGIMERIAPFNFQYNSMLIAQSLSAHYPDRYTARNLFSRALLYQAKYKRDNVDVRDSNGVDFEAGTNVYFKTLRKEGRHISPRTLDILKGLGVLYNGAISSSQRINYKEVM